MRYLIFVLPLALFAIVGVVFWSGFAHNPAEVPSVLIDKPVPAFDLPPLPGMQNGLSSEGLKGDVALVNVFASWCIPCKVEHPVITRLAREEKVPVYGINHKDKAEDALEWLAVNGNPYSRIGADLNGRVSIDWGVYGVPETFLIDRDGHIRFKHVGPLTPEVVEDRILPLIKHLRGQS